MLVKTGIRAIRSGGTAEWFGGDGRDFRIDTFTCAHCNAVHYLPHADTAHAVDEPLSFGHCLQCQKTICGKCADDGRCLPFEKQIEAMEASDRFHRQIAGILR